MSVDRVLSRLNLPSVEEIFGIEDAVKTVVGLNYPHGTGNLIESYKLLLENKREALHTATRAVLTEFELHAGILNHLIVQASEETTVDDIAEQCIRGNVSPNNDPRQVNKHHVQLAKNCLERLYCIDIHAEDKVYREATNTMNLRVLAPYSFVDVFASRTRLENASLETEQDIFKTMTDKKTRLVASNIFEVYDSYARHTAIKDAQTFQRLSRIAQHIKRREYYGFSRMLQLPEYALSMPIIPEEVAISVLHELGKMMATEEKAEITDKIYVPLALFKLFQQLKGREDLAIRAFNQYLEEGRLREFCADDSITINTAINDLEFPEEYRDRFHQLISSMPGSERWTLTPEFKDIYTQACKTGWEDHLEDHLDSIQGMLKWHRLAALLARQESGALIELLQDEQTREAITDHPDNLRYETLLQLKETNEQAYRLIINNLSNATQTSIDKIIEISAHIPLNDFDLGKTSRTILANARISSKEDAENIALLLQDQELIDEAASYNIFSNPDYRKPNRLAEWHRAHRQKTIEELRQVKRAERYFGPYKGKNVRRACIALREKTDTLDALLRPFQDLDPASYQRIITLLCELDHPKEALRRREMQNLLYNFSGTGRWDHFAEQVVQINASRAKEYDPLIKEYGGHVTKREKADGSISKTIEAHMAAQGTGIYTLFEEVLDLREEYPAAIIDAAQDAVIDGQARVLAFILPHMREGVQEKTVAEFFEVYKRDEDLDSASPYELIEGWPAEETQEIEIEETKPEATAQDWCDEHGFPHELLERILVSGFKLNGSKLIGMNYTRARHVKSNTGGGADEGQMGQYFDKMIQALHRDNAIIHHSRKGGTVTTGCIAINPHLDQVENENLRDYMSFLLYHRHQA